MGPFLIHTVFSEKLFFDIRDQWPEILGDLSTSIPIKIYSLILAFKKRMFLGLADYFIVVKKGEPSFLRQKYNIDKENIIYLPNGLLLTEDQPFSVQQNKKQDNSNLKIIYTGSLNYYYRLLEFCKLICRYNFLEFHIYGSGIQQYQVEKFVEKCDNIYYYGRISPDKINNLLKKYDLAYNGLQESKMNQYGISTNKLFEYFSVELPVISFCESDYDPVRLSGAGFAGKNKEEIDEILQRLKSVNPSELSEIGQKGKEYLHENHNFYKNINKLISHLE